MRLILITMVLFLAGCERLIESWELEQLQEQCKDKGGIHHINTMIYAKARCRDGEIGGER